jgi:hypothetical protein
MQKALYKVGIILRFGKHMGHKTVIKIYRLPFPFSCGNFNSSVKSVLTVFRILPDAMLGDSTTFPMGQATIILY